MELIQLQTLVHVFHVQLGVGLMKIGPSVSLVLLDLLVLRLILNVNPVRMDTMHPHIILVHVCLVELDFGLI